MFRRNIEGNRRKNICYSIPIGEQEYPQETPVLEYLFNKFVGLHG